MHASNHFRGCPVKLRFVGVLIFGLWAWGAAPTGASTVVGGLRAPEGLKPCAPGDPAASAEARVAEQLGGEFLGCFRSDREVVAPIASNPATTSIEYAFAIALHGGGYTPADLDSLLSTVRGQWKDFDPLSKEFRETYTARLNDLIRSNGSTLSPTVISVSPVLVSIDRKDVHYYLVTSIRTIVLELQGKQVALTKVNSDAVVLCGSRLVRLTIQRPLSDPHDVAQVQGEMADWARATAQCASPIGP
jgi:hypothetical protein